MVETALQIFSKLKLHNRLQEEQLELLQTSDSPEVIQLVVNLIYLMIENEDAYLQTLHHPLRLKYGLNKSNIAVGTYVIAREHLATVFAFLENPQPHIIRKMGILLKLNIHTISTPQSTLAALIELANPTLIIPGSHNIEAE